MAVRHASAVARARRAGAHILLRGMRGRPHGDRLDKAGQPGGSVSAVYSPAAALRHAGHARRAGQRRPV